MSSHKSAMMSGYARALLMSSCLSLLLAGAAFGGEGVDVKITNDGAEPILVNVYDTSTSPERVVLSNTRIYGFTSVPVSLIADGTGRGNLSWTATSTDPVFRTCGHASTVVGDAASVNVHADSSCSG